MVTTGDDDCENQSTDAIIWLHGAGLSGRTWRSDVPGMKPDLPGHGQNPCIPEPSVERYADSIAPHLPHRFALVGHSLGGMVALELAARHPDKVRALVLAEAVPTVLQSSASTWIARIAKAVMSHISPKRLAWLSGLSEPAKVKNHLREQIGSMTVQGIQDGLTAAMRYDGRPHLAEIQCPTMVVIGERNKATHAGARLFHEGIASSQLMTLSGGHMIHVENAERFYTTVLGFLGDKK
ncbi:alpha/beta hydrolase [Parasphingorhabdus litoris]|uniref:Alpha/beta hydrolase n=1 Tax=Parasphingorhabdus litoris TaxID=394733 RepID=A0ABN1A8V9_9SPHN|nr:alpha/beta fold hydrolase [Parasphingorhabdus litoris]